MPQDARDEVQVARAKKKARFTPYEACLYKLVRPIFGLEPAALYKGGVSAKRHAEIQALVSAAARKCKLKHGEKQRR